MNSRLLEKYLRRNPEHKKVVSVPTRTLFKAAIVVPACDELDFLPATLNSINSNPLNFLSQTCVVIVINNHANTAPEILNNNQQTIELLKKHKINFQLFVIDASSPGFEISAKGGVGEARKIGMDYALRILDWSKEPLLFCLDADTTVEPDYIEKAFEFFGTNANAVAGVFDFKHQRGNTQEEESAIRAYEAYMYSYVNELKYAGSPYAYHSIGSTIVCLAEAYVKCGGMKVKNGGEDFYFLQSLRKLGEIKDITNSMVHPSSRPSERVPFGTGPKIRQITAGKEICHHDHAIFILLKQVIDKVEKLEMDKFEQLPSELLELSPVTAKFLQQNNFKAAWDKIFKNTPKEKCYMCKAFHTWFDAFRTLKFVHFCEDKE